MPTGKPGPYDDIIHLPHHVSTTHPRMSLHDRAAQFAPFAALTGHDAAVRETARLTDDAVELDESRKIVLNQKLQDLAAMLATQPEITVTYFLPDTKKGGGSYPTVTGHLKKIDPYRHTLLLTDQTEIPIDQICQLESDLFRIIDPEQTF